MSKNLNHPMTDNPRTVGAKFAMKKWVMLLACTALFGFNHPANAANKSTSPQGDSWDSIKKLPDWSGVWALDLEGHLAASEEGANSPLVPLTPKYLKLRADSFAARAQQSLSFCLPAGVPGIMLHTIQYEFLFTPGQITMLTENGEVRRFYTDGRAHRSLGEMAGSYEGDSIGHWEGKTLVVDTIGFPKGTLFKDFGLGTTKHTHYVERIFLKDKDHLQIDSTIDDPEIFTKPYAATRVYERLGPSFPMQEPQCNEANRDADGKLNLTPPEE